MADEEDVLSPLLDALIEDARGAKRINWKPESLSSPAYYEATIAGIRICVGRNRSGTPGLWLTFGETRIETKVDARTDDRQIRLHDQLQELLGHAEAQQRQRVAVDVAKAVRAVNEGHTLG